MQIQTLPTDTQIPQPICNPLHELLLYQPRYTLRSPALSWYLPQTWSQSHGSACLEFCACNHHSLLTVQVPKFCASFVSEERKNSLLKYAWKKCGIPNLSKHKFFACGKQTNKIGPCFDHDDTATASHSDPSRICLEGSIKGLVTLQRKLVGCKLPLVIRP